MKTHENNEDIDGIIDLEEHCKKSSGRKPPRAHKYRIRIDKVKYVISQSSITGRELLALAGKTPIERYLISQKKHGGRVDPIGPDEVVDLCKPGIERFVTLPMDQHEGENAFRREFSLPSDEIENLEAHGLQWEAVCEGKQQWLVVRDWKVIDGFNHKIVDVALLIGAAYPTTQIDMAYFFPELLPANGKKLKACDHKQVIEGRQWQRWSRHRSNPSNEWREGVDSIYTHLLQVVEWLRREVA